MNYASGTAEDLSSWFQRQGQKVTSSESSKWVQAAAGICQAFPYHQLIRPSEDELQGLLKRYRFIALRYSTPLSSNTGHVSYHMVYEKASYLPGMLHKKVRHDIARGLNHAIYEPVSLERLAAEGWRLQRDTLIRQNRQHAQTEEGWKQMCLAAGSLAGFQPWGAIHNGELVATLLSFTQDDTVTILFQQSSTDHIQFGINNALTYVFTHETMLHPGIHCIFYGLHSLDAPPTVDQFKVRMGYTAKPVRQRVVFHPAAQPFVNSTSHLLLKKIKKLLPGNCTVSKAEGIFRFYLQGCLPLYKQTWPKVMEDMKSELLT